MASSMPRRFPPSFPVTPPKACAALWYKRRRGDTELCGALAGCPLSRLAATALPKGEPSLASPFGGGAPLWGAERASCQRPPPMGCIEALAGCPLSHGFPYQAAAGVCRQNRPAAKEKALTKKNLLCYTGSTSKKRFFFCACFSEGGRGENAPKIFP